MSQYNNNGQQSMTNIICPHYNDVLNGRGKFAMHWNGNRFFRTLVDGHKSEYLKADNDAKVLIGKTIINAVRAQNPAGRFLKLDARTNRWNDIGNKKAIRKIRQALREGTTNSIPSSVESSYNGSQQRSIASSNNDSENVDDLDIVSESFAVDTVEVSDEMNTEATQEEMAARDEIPPSYSAQSNAVESSFHLYNQVHDLFFIDEGANLSEFDPKDVFSSEERL